MSTKQKAKSSPANKARGAVLITGSEGYLGHLVTRGLAADPRNIPSIVALDIREPDSVVEGVKHKVMDIRSDKLEALLRDHKIDTVVHLAAIVSAPPGMTRAEQQDIDVGGTRNLLEACVSAGVRKVVITSSAGAYGYWPDNAALLSEESPLRGNETFAYSHHKRLIEELLADYREAHPELEQLIFRPGTILGESVSNPITAIFERPVVVGVKGSEVPFCFIWDQDVVSVVLEGIRGSKSGVFNVIGDGVMTLREIATVLGKPYVELPPRAFEGILDLLHRLGLSHYGSEQLDFIRYRPVPWNQKLRTVFGYSPKLNSRQVFELYRRSHLEALARPMPLEKAHQLKAALCSRLGLRPLGS